MDIINKVIWLVTTSVILLSGIFFSIKLGFPQFRIKRIFKSIKNKSNNCVSVLDSLMMSLSSRIGVGSIAGIALAIKYGGIGSIFWIWIITIVVSSISYLESIYGARYKEKIKWSTLVGGPHYYIDKVLNKKVLARIYALLIIVSYGIGFITIQTNTVSKVAVLSTNWNLKVISIIILLTATYCLFSSSHKKSKIIGKMVPLMTGLYLLLGVFVLLFNFRLVTKTIIDIVVTAFNYKALGGSVIYSLIVGMQRAIFSTEVGIGTSAISSAMTDTQDENQGYVQILGNYITSFIICTITALIILSSNFHNYIDSSTNGIELAYFAFKYHFGSIGKIFIFICIVLFAYSTIISGFYYGEVALQYLTKKKVFNFIYKLIVIIFIFISCWMSATKIWTLIDISVAFLCLINIYAIILIYKKSNK